MIVVVPIHLQHFAHELSGLFRAKTSTWKHYELLRHWSVSEVLVSIKVYGLPHDRILGMMASTVTTFT